MSRYKSRYKKCIHKVRKTKSNVTSVGPSTERSMMFLSDEGPVRSKRLTWLISPIYISAANTPTFCILLVYSLKSSKFYRTLPFSITIRFLFIRSICHFLINILSWTFVILDVLHRISYFKIFYDENPTCFN